MKLPLSFCFNHLSKIKIFRFKKIPNEKTFWQCWYFVLKEKFGCVIFEDIKGQRKCYVFSNEYSDNELFNINRYLNREINSVEMYAEIFPQFKLKYI